MKQTISYPSVFTFSDGTPVTTKDDFQKRKQEIRKLYEENIYGVSRNGEQVSYELTKKDGEFLLNISVSYSGASGNSNEPNDSGISNSSGVSNKPNDSGISNGSGVSNKPDDSGISNGSGISHKPDNSGNAQNRQSSFLCKVFLPDRNSLPEAVLHKDGSPVILAMWDFAQKDYVLSRDIAVITFPPLSVASDNAERTGAFYEIYPYGPAPESQSGALIAWGWAFSKILDALYNGVAEALQINPASNMITGVSRFGKATFLAGAMDSRIKITVPACSGAGGTALFRYRSTGDSYDYSSLGESSCYTFGQNEPLGSLQSTDERHWFNDKFLSYTSEEELPVDQHFLSSLFVGEDRYLFITASYLAEDWTNPPAMWENYLMSRQIFQHFGETEHLYFHIHKQGHAVIDEDVELLTAYMEHFLYGKPTEIDFSAVPDCLFTNPL